MANRPDETGGYPGQNPGALAPEGGPDLDPDPEHTYRGPQITIYPRATPELSAALMAKLYLNDKK